MTEGDPLTESITMKALSAYLGIDIGTKCGFARYDQLGKGGSYMTGAWDFKVREGDSPVLRYVRFSDQLRQHLVLGVDRVFYEKVERHMGNLAARVYSSFLLKLQETCEEFDVPYEGIPVGTVKKFATGKGNAGKPLVQKACTAWGFNWKTEDEADAIAILKCGMETKL